MGKKPTYKDLEQRIKALEKDALEHRRTKERFQHITAVLTSIRHVGHLITKERDRERLITRVCESLVRHRGYHNAWSVLTDDSGKLLSMAEAGLGANVLPILKKIEEGELPHCCKNVMTKPGLLVVREPPAVCTNCPISQMYQGRGALATRLEYDGKNYGILTVSVPEIFISDPEEHELFRDLAGDIAFALYSMEANEERRQVEEKLRTARDELERRVKERTNELELLSSKLLNAQEEERKRIAGDLHDGIGQSLSAIKFMVETNLEQMGGKLPESDLQCLRNLVPMLQKASEEVRTIVMNLRPSILDDLGILATIGWFCRQFRTVYSDIRVEEKIQIRESDVPEDLKIIIFRVLQEAMNNVAKYSMADTLCLSLKKTDSGIELLITDNGRGFDVPAILSAASSEKGFGITGMKERTELSGGSFKIESSPDAGTTVRAYWKYH
jgi:signal transduction histidine kinase